MLNGWVRPGSFLPPEPCHEALDIRSISLCEPKLLVGVSGSVSRLLPCTLLQRAVELPHSSREILHRFEFCRDYKIAMHRDAPSMSERQSGYEICNHCLVPGGQPKLPQHLRQRGEDFCGQMGTAFRQLLRQLFLKA